MLSKDEISKGINFILRLSNEAGTALHWVEMLSGETAVHWYEIYRSSDYQALRTEGAHVFRHRVGEAEAEHVRRSCRCIVIHTASVKAEEIDPPSGHAMPLST